MARARCCTGSRTLLCTSELLPVALLLPGCKHTVVLVCAQAAADMSINQLTSSVYSSSTNKSGSMAAGVTRSDSVIGIVAVPSSA